MTNPTAGAWFFKVDTLAGDVLAVEPDGTTHKVKAGDWGSLAGTRLLNRMVHALTKPAVARAHICPPKMPTHEAQPEDREVHRLEPGHL